MPFLLPCYRTLKKQMGELDAICECTELAVRDFAYSAKAAKSVESYVGQLSKKHNVRVNVVDLKQLRQSVVRLYISNVHQSLEEFLLSMKTEHPFGQTWDMGGPGDRLTKTASAVGLGATPARRLCDHYRSIRNAIAHPNARPGRDSDAPIELLELRTLVDHVGRIGRSAGVSDEPGAASAASTRTLEAPNGFWELSFDDFILYTRSAKALAKQLCVSSRPTDRELAELAAAHAAKHTHRVSDHKIQRRLMLGFLRTEYSLSDAESDTVLTELAS